MAQVTIKNADDNVADRLRAEGFSRLGPKYLDAAYMLDQCDILQHMLIMYKNANKPTDRTILLDIMEKAVGIGRIIDGSDQDGQAVNGGKDAVETVPAAESKAPKFSV